MRLKFKFDVLVIPSLLRSKKKSLALTFEAGMQGNPLIDVDAFKSATQKSCNESGSADREGTGRSSNIRRQDSRWRGEFDDFIMAARDSCFLESTRL